MIEKRTINLLWTFYKSTLLTSIGFAIPVMVFAGFVPGLIIFVFFGLVLNFLYKEVNKKQEYFFYYNCNLSRRKLFLFSFAINLYLGVTALLIYFLI